MKKILIINTGGLAIGGITSHIFTYMCALLHNRKDYEVTLVATIFKDPNVISMFEQIGCHVVSFPNRKVELCKYVKSLWNLYRQGHYDAVHVHGSSSILVIELFLAMIARIPIRIAHSHSITCEHKLANIILFPLFNLSYNRAIGCSKKAYKWLFKNENYFVLHNVFNFEDYYFDVKKRNQTRTLFGLDDGTLAFVSVGHIDYVKNQEFSISLVKQVSKYRKVKYYIIGDGEMRDELERKVHDEGLDNIVTFTGTRKDIKDIIHGFDIFLMPSLYEGLPIALLEAEATGLKCLISNSVTLEAKLYDDAEYFKLDNVEEWITTIVNYRVDLRKREKNSLTALGKLREDYDIEKEIIRLQNIYDGKRY